MAPACIPVAPEMKRKSPALMAAAAEERVEEEEGDCNYAGGEIAVFVEKLCGMHASKRRGGGGGGGGWRRRRSSSSGSSSGSRSRRV